MDKNEKELQQKKLLHILDDKYGNLKEFETLYILKNQIEFKFQYDLRDIIDSKLEFDLYERGIGYLSACSSSDSLYFIKLNDENKELWLTQKCMVKLTKTVPNNIDTYGEFEAELRKFYIFQSSEQWEPAYGSGTEIGILISISIGWFFNNVIIPGIAYDLFKKFIRRLYLAFKKLNNPCKKADLLNIECIIDGVTIVIDGDLADSPKCLLRIAQDFYDNYLYLKKQGINAINKISMPYEKVPNIKAHFSQMIDLPLSNDYWWKISYSNGCSICYYNPSSKIIIDNLNQISN